MSRVALEAVSLFDYRNIDRRPNSIPTRIGEMFLELEGYYAPFINEKRNEHTHFRYFLGSESTYTRIHIQVYSDFVNAYQTWLSSGCTTNSTPKNIRIPIEFCRTLGVFAEKLDALFQERFLNYDLGLGVIHG